MEEKTANIPAINCGHCVMNIKRELMEIEGVTSVDGDAASKTITVKWSAPADWDTISSLLGEIGYPPE